MRRLDYKPEFMQYARENIDLAKSRHNKNKEFAYKKVLSSLQKYPLPIYFTKDALCLEGVGDKILEGFEARLKRAKINIVRDNPAQAAAALPDPVPTIASDEPPRPKKKSSYIPKRGSLGYEIILVLFTHGLGSTKTSLAFDQLLSKLALKTSLEEQMSPNAVHKRCKTLYDHDLVLFAAEHVNPTLSLTEKGNALAKGILELRGETVLPRILDKTSFTFVDKSGRRTLKKHEAYSTFHGGSFFVLLYAVANHPYEDYPELITRLPIQLASIINTSATQDESAAGFSLFFALEDEIPDEALGILYISHMQAPHDQTYLEFGYDEYEIVLALDSRETKTTDSSLSIQDKLQEKNIRFMQKQLPLGDYMWLGKISRTSGQNEASAVPRFVVLGFIGERKRVDDLASSIVDGRLNDQRIRLSRSKIKNKYLLVEDLDRAGASGSAICHNGTMANQLVSPAGLYLAMTNAQICSELSILRTSSVTETANLLLDQYHFLKAYMREKRLLVRTSDPSLIQICKQKKISIDPTKMEFDERLIGEEVFGAFMKVVLYQNFVIQTHMDKEDSIGNLKTIFAAQVSCVSGISNAKALALASRYGTLSQFLTENKQGPDHYLLELLGKAQTKKLLAFFQDP